MGLWALEFKAYVMKRIWGSLKHHVGKEPERIMLVVVQILWHLYGS